MEPAGVGDTADAGLRSESLGFPVSSSPAASRFRVVRVPHASHSRCPRPCRGRSPECAPRHHDVPIGLGEYRHFPASAAVQAVDWAPCGSARAAAGASASTNRAQAQEYRSARTSSRARRWGASGEPGVLWCWSSTPTPPFRSHNVMAKWELSGTGMRAGVMSVTVTTPQTREARLRRAVVGVCAPAGYNATPCGRWVREPGSGTRCDGRADLLQPCRWRRQDEHDS